MSKTNQPFNPQADSPTVRVRKSYYSFSKTYPKQGIALEEKRKPKKKSTAIIRAGILIVCFVVLLGVSFFVTDVFLRISEKPITEEEGALIPNVETDLTNVKALSVSYDVLSETGKTRACIRQLRRKDCNSVVIDFKTDEGYLAYTSSELYAIRTNSNLYDTKNTRAALTLFEKEGIQVFAGIHCFDDMNLAQYDPSTAVKYLGTDVLWLTAPEEEGGKPWLDPFQTKVRAYLKNVIQEIASLGVNGIILKSYAFPVGQAVETATFAGDESSQTHNQLLKKLIRSIKLSLHETCALLLNVDANDMSGNAEKYDGSIFPNDCDGIICNTAVRPAEIILDREDGYSKIISYYHNVIGESNNAAFLLEIPKAEASNAYLRALSRNGYSAYIIDR